VECEHKEMFDRISGDRVCTKCGLVLSEHNPIVSRDQIYIGHGSLAFGSKENTLLIQQKYRRFKRTEQITRKNKYIWSVKGWLSGELRYFKEVQNIPDYLITEVTDLFIEIHNHRLMKFGSKHDFLLASLRILANYNDFFFNLDLAIERYNTDKRKVFKITWVIINSLQMKPLVQKLNLEVGYYCSVFNLSAQIHFLAECLVRELIDYKLQIGKNPKGIIAAVLLIAANREGERISLNHLITILNISKQTIKNRVRDIEKILNQGSKRKA